MPSHGIRDEAHSNAGRVERKAEFFIAFGATKHSFLVEKIALIGYSTDLTMS